MPINKRIALRIGLHLFLILLVLILPPLVYDYISHTNLSNVPGILMLGGLSYPAYFSYLATRLHSDRARLILLHLIAMLTISFFMLDASGRTTPLIMLLLPAILGLIMLPAAAIARLRMQRALAINCLWSSLVSGPIGLILSMLAIYGAGMSAMSGMRW
ncbi:hypothetical protein UNDKW_0010 [Undibacterium sp. KW1]|uniref:hypothetical protein n=1 Tax=Undibacterium sp. KW1 TaxID=2058624 RepID=UPI001331F35E|nr:hypothetical protein [Undibacterium sp. KW1]BBB58283.1 hypothetical protein UNDKW_0010 [Undibacterium sp. KW1]